MTELPYDANYEPIPFPRQPLPFPTRRQEQGPRPPLNVWTQGLPTVRELPTHAQQVAALDALTEGLSQAFHRDSLKLISYKQPRLPGF